MKSKRRADDPEKVDSETGDDPVAEGSVLKKNCAARKCLRRSEVTCERHLARQSRIAVVIGECLGWICAEPAAGTIEDAGHAGPRMGIYEARYLVIPVQ